MSLKKFAYKYEYLKLELQEIEEELDKFKPEWLDKFNKYFSQIPATAWKNTETGEIKFAFEEKIKRTPSERLKKLYRKISTKLHPDKGGKSEDFTSFKDFYEEGNIIEMIQSAAKYDLDIPLDEEDIKLFNESCELLEHKIKERQGSLIYNFFKGDDTMKKIVISKLQQQYEIKIPNKDIKKLLS